VPDRGTPARAVRPRAPAPPQQNIDFPALVQGRIGRDISTPLGSGGALVRAETMNGGVRVIKY